MVEEVLVVKQQEDLLVLVRRTGELVLPVDSFNSQWELLQEVPVVLAREWEEEAAD